MNDINVMPGIDFKANKERMKRKKKKIRKINKLVNIGIILAIVILFIAVIYANKNMTDSAMESCQELGNTYEFCIAHV